MTVFCPFPRGEETGCSSRLWDPGMMSKEAEPSSLLPRWHWRDPSDNYPHGNKQKALLPFGRSALLSFPFLNISDTKFSHSMDFFITVMCAQASEMHKLLFCTANNCAVRIIHFPHNTSALKAIFQQLGRRKRPAEGWDQPIFSFSFMFENYFSEYLHILTGNAWEAARLTCPSFSTHTWWHTSVGCDFLCVASFLKFYLVSKWIWSQMKW